MSAKICLPNLWTPGFAGNQKLLLLSDHRTPELKAYLLPSKEQKVVLLVVFFYHIFFSLVENQVKETVAESVDVQHTQKLVLLLGTI